jgi:SiaC family regulatory phosphoprotein
MENAVSRLCISGTKVTPSFFLDPESRSLDISGQSYPEDAALFYREIIQALRVYLQNNQGPFTVRFMLDYFNTSSSKYLRHLLEILEKEHRLERAVRALWYYDITDPDMEDVGRDLTDGLHFPTEYVGVER